MESPASDSDLSNYDDDEQKIKKRRKSSVLKKRSGRKSRRRSSKSIHKIRKIDNDVIDSAAINKPTKDFGAAFVQKSYLAELSVILSRHTKFDKLISGIIHAVKKYIHFVYPDIPTGQIDNWYANECSSIEAILDIDRCVLSTGNIPRHNIPLIVNWNYVNYIASTMSCSRAIAARWIDSSGDDVLDSELFRQWHILFNNLWEETVGVWTKLNDEYSGKIIKMWLSNTRISAWFDKSVLDTWINYNRHLPLEASMFVNGSISVDDGYALWNLVYQLFEAGTLMFYDYKDAIEQTQSILRFCLMILQSNAVTEELLVKINRTVKRAIEFDESIANLWYQD